MQTDRRMCEVLEKDDPYRIDPASMTHSVVIVEAAKTNMTGVKVGKLVDDVQALLNPTYWTLVAQCCQQGRISSLSHLATLSIPVEAKALFPVLDQLEVPDSASVFVRSALMSLDGGRTKQQVFAVIAFKESEPKLIISTKEPIGVDSLHKEPPHRREDGRSGAKPWWKFW